jgi:hypothetical protein
MSSETESVSYSSPSFGQDLLNYFDRIIQTIEEISIEHLLGPFDSRQLDLFITKALPTFSGNGTGSIRISLVYKSTNVEHSRMSCLLPKPFVFSFPVYMEYIGDSDLEYRVADLVEKVNPDKYLPVFTVETLYRLWRDLASGLKVVDFSQPKWNSCIIPEEKIRTVQQELTIYNNLVVYFSARELLTAN